MSEALQEHPDQNILDALKLALGDVDFEPIDPAPTVESDNPSMPIISGSVRFKYAYDFEARSVVHVVEAYALLESEPGQVPEEDHRLIVWWEGDDDMGEEFDLDNREVIYNEDEENSEENITSSKRRLMQALRAIMTDG